MAESIEILQRSTAPADIWLRLTNDADENVDPTGLICSLDFRYQTAWTTFAGEVVTLEDGQPYIHLTIPDSFRANISNREFNVRVTVGGITYRIWSYRLAFG